MFIVSLWVLVIIGIDHATPIYFHSEIACQQAAEAISDIANRPAICFPMGERQ